MFGSRPAGLACPNAHWTVVNNTIVTLSRLKTSADEVIQILTEKLDINFQSKISTGLNHLKSTTIFDNQLNIQRINDILDDNKRCKSKRITVP